MCFPWGKPWRGIEEEKERDGTRVLFCLVRQFQNWGRKRVIILSFILGREIFFNYYYLFFKYFLCEKLWEQQIPCDKL